MKTADKTRETPAFPKTFIMAMIFGVGLNPVNSTLISTALAPISHDLRIDAGRATLLISALYLTCAIAQPTAVPSRSRRRASFLRSLVLARCSWPVRHWS